MLKLRPAEMADWARLFAWRNDPETRERFKQQQVVRLDAHLAWLADVIASETGDLRLFVADDQQLGIAVGTARLDLVTRPDGERWAEVSVTVEPHRRGHGYASQILDALVDAGRRWPVTGLIATVKPDNFASLRAFASCGFIPTKTRTSLVTLERLCDPQP